MYTIFVILICIMFWLVGYLLFTGGRFKKSVKKQIESQLDLKNTHLHVQSIGWQEIHSHVRLNELLSIQGKTLSGDEFKIIISLGIGTNLCLIYLRVGSIIHRVPAGQSGLIEVKQGDAFRLIYEKSDITLTSLVNSIDASHPEKLLGENYFSMVLSLTNSLVDGLKISYAARCASLEGRFIKTWDIPNQQSDEAIRSQISSIEDIAALAEKVKNVQLASNFTSRNIRAVPLDYGVCYLLGKSGGMRLKFVIDSEVALLIVSEYNPDINLSDFLKSLAVSAQMHAKVIKKDGFIQLVTQNKNGDYSAVSLSKSNILISIELNENTTLPVLRIELDETNENILDVYYQATSCFNNVLIWKNVLPIPRPL